MTPPEQARVEQRHRELAADIAEGWNGNPAQLLANFERDIRAEMKRAVLAEIEEIWAAGIRPTDPTGYFGGGFQALDELKRRIEEL